MLRTLPLHPSHPPAPNSQGKARLLVQFKDQAAAAAAAAAIKASTNRTRAVLDLKRTFLQNARVGLAIQLQRVAREAGHEQATFRAEDGLGWDFIVYKESLAAAPNQGLPLHPPLPWRTAPRPGLSLQLSRHSPCH